VGRIGELLPDKRVSMTLQFHTKINWKVVSVFLGATALYLVLASPFETDRSAWEFYDQMVLGYEMIQDIELSELEDEFQTVVSERNDCYRGLSNLSARLSVCRKQYLTDILALARQNIKSSPSMGKFLLCVQECPLSYSMCRGTVTDEVDPDADCTLNEVKCIEGCLDLYWRGN
tara:strand:- start:276 stop:797 length:522 start_codon:yes stop_codon:yes gene_type:complete